LSKEPFGERVKDPLYQEIIKLDETIH
jgi:hypothetical protein